ncbi:hypothetical protein SAMN05216233_11997 [Desulfoluna spongiiphila]|uniref:DUF4115 domain-containing protein n=1 Tax=Desulfoluna spongiiphila TaxID=419481 RepID=A0A1G5IFA9_9BACT|nr:hypothetical protein SAMN05216233_11997 [Desulfoluna spongiiphila]VVS95448.1 consensus disorder prediction [Desulfoluna spongiiphila]
MTPPETNVSQQAEPPSEARIIPEKKVKEKRRPEKTREGLLLEILSAGKGQVKVSADGSLPKPYAMKQGERISIRAVESFNILLEDKCAVALFYNGRPVEIPGPCGRPVNLWIP